MVQYFTEAFFQQVAETATNDPDFQAKGAKLKANILMVATDKNEAYLLRADGGKVASEKATPETPADFAFLADYATWVSSHQGGAPLEKLVMTGKVKFKGNMLKIMPIRGALASLDDAGRKVQAEY